MSDLTKFRDHAAAMARAEHKPECPSLHPVPWPPGGWVPTDGEDSMNGLTWIGPPPPPPECSGCLTDADRALFARLAGEVDAYLAPQPDLFGGETKEPAPSRGGGEGSE